MDTNNMSMESIKGELFGAVVKTVEENNEESLSVTLEGYEDILLDEINDESFFAAESFAALTEATAIDMMFSVATESEDYEISEEAEDAEKASKVKKIAETTQKIMKAFWDKLKTSIANFIKQIQVFIAGATFKGQIKFYTEKVAGNESDITSSTNKFSGIKVVGDIDKFIELFTSFITFDVIGTDKDGGGIKALGDLLIGMKGIEELFEGLSDEDKKNSNYIVNNFFYGSKTKKNAEISAKDFFEGEVTPDFLSAKSAAKLKAFVDGGKKTLKEIKKDEKAVDKAMKGSDSKEVNESAASTASIRAVYSMRVNLLLTAYLEFSSIRAMVQRACSAGLKKTEE